MCDRDFQTITPLQTKILLYAIFPLFNAPARVSAPARFSPPPPHKTSNFDKRPYSSQHPPSDKGLRQIGLDFARRIESHITIFNQLTSKSLGLFFFIGYSAKYIYAVQK